MFMLKSLLDSDVVRFGIVGLANTAFGLTMIFCAKFAGFGDISSNFFGYCCGIILSFLLNSRWTFRFQGKAVPAFLVFCLILLASYLLNLTAVMIALRVMGINSYLAQAIGIIPYTLASYIGCRFLVFRPKNVLATTTDHLINQI